MISNAVEQDTTMRFLGILVTLAIIGYGAHLYLKSNSTTTVQTLTPNSQPKQYIDQAKQTSDIISKSASQHTRAIEDMSQ